MTTAECKEEQITLPAKRPMEEETGANDDVAHLDKKTAVQVQHDDKANQNDPPHTVDSEEIQEKDPNKDQEKDKTKKNRRDNPYRNKGKNKQNWWDKVKEKRKEKQEAAENGQVVSSKVKNTTAPPSIKSEKRNKDWRPLMDGGIEMMEADIAAAEAAREGTNDTENETKEERFPKRKVAVLMGFAGFKYRGMQINHNAETIESHFFKALWKAQGVSRANAFNPTKISFIRCARTDKGVSAVGQIVSLKMQFPVEESEMIERLNSHLPADIRVWDIIRVQNNFNAKNEASSRVYEYMLPTYVFHQPTDDSWSLDRMTKALEIGCWDMNDPASLSVEARKSFRMNAEQLESFRSCLKTYEGTHNYWNFTTEQKFEQANSKRYIISCTSSDPFIIQDLEYVRITIHGQSFMLHQIRKMIGLSVFLVRLGIPNPTSIINLSFTNTRLNISKAPALGLFLVECKTAGYNKVVKEKAKQNNLVREGLGFEKYKEKMDKFKEDFIYSEMYKQEMESGVFGQWLHAVDAHAPEHMYFLNQEGTLKPEWILKRISENTGNAEDGEETRDGAEEREDNEE